MLEFQLQVYLIITSIERDCVQSETVVIMKLFTVENIGKYYLGDMTML